MDLRQLECAVAVARHEHVTRAAEALHLTQSAVSQHLLRLEAELGVRLFHRGPHGTTPTAAGRELLARAEPILAAVGDARVALAGYAAGEPARVRLLAAPAEVPGLAAALAAVLAVDGPLRPSLAEAAAATVIDAVRRGTADLGLVALHGPAPAGLDVVPLAPDPLVVLGPGGPSADAPEERPVPGIGELRGRPVLLPARGSAARAAADAAFAAVGFSPLPRFEVADPAAARTLVGAGLAVGVVPASWAATDRSTRASPLADGAAVGPVLLHRPELSPAARALAAALRSALG